MSSDETPSKETELPEQTLAVDAPSADGQEKSETVDSTVSTADHNVSASTTGEPNAEDSAADQPRRKVRLNPTVDATQAKAVPTLGAAPTVAVSNSTPAAQASSPTTATLDSSVAESTATSETETSIASATNAEQNSAPVESSAPIEQTAPSKPVEIPPPPADLDAQMEAEIEAALASGEIGVVPKNVSNEEMESAAEPITEESLEQGTRLQGKIQSVHGDDVFLDLGLRSPGVVPKRQFVSGKKPEVGQHIEVTVEKVNEEEGLILLNLPKGLRKASNNWESIEVGQIVDCMVTKTNKGGLEVTVSRLRGFLPAGQIDFSYVSDLEPYVGQKLRVKIIDANPKKRNLVVSRRAFLQIERKETEANLWKTLAEGQTFAGTIKTIKDYGAFVDIGGGVDGFLHIGEISWTRLKHPSEAIKEGQQVEVKVINLDPEKKKISLGMKQLTQNPWLAAVDKYASGTTVSGKVTRTADFGAFVELEPGLEGLIHVSELDYKRVNRVEDVLKAGQAVDAKVLEVDPKRKRISLSLKALLEKPAELKPDEDLSPGGGETYQRKHKGPLKGGTGSSSGSGLFGNPNDFSSK